MSTGGRPGGRFALARAVAVAGLLLLTTLARAQDGVGAREVRFRTYTPTDGLSQATARAIAQDRDGFIWVGTQDGLNRFDGYGFKIYRHDRDADWSLAQNHVWALLADPDGSLWVGTQAGGLDRYDPALDRFESYPPAEPDAGTASQLVSALMRDRDGRIWVGNGGGRLQWVDREHERLIDTPLGEHASLRMVRALLQAQDGSVWIGTYQGLFRTDRGATSWTEVRADSDQPLDITALAQTPNGELWAGTTSAGLYRVAADGTLIAHYRHDEHGCASGLPDDEILSLLADPDGSLWIGGNTQGLSHFDPARGAFQRFEHDPTRADTIGSDRIAALFRERNGLLFAGSWNNGFSVHDPRTRAFALIDRVRAGSNVIPAPAAALYADADGSLWIGISGGGGLLHIDLAGQVLRHYRHVAGADDSLSHDFIYNILRTRDGSLWVTTIGGGIDRLKADGSGFEHWRHDPKDATSLASDRVLLLYEDSAGTLWAGTMDEGLDEHCSGCSGFRHHVHDAANPASAGGDAVSAIRELRNGEFWVAYRSAGIDRLDRTTGRFEHFRSRSGDPASLSSDAVSVLAEDAHGDLWVGTQGGGLDHRVGGNGSVRFETIDSRDGLGADAIGAILEASPGVLWVSTTAGISRVARGTDGTQIVNFDGRNGAQPRGYWVSAASRMPDGRLVFGGLDGITIVDWRAVGAAPQPHPIITGLSLSNVPVVPRWRDPGSPIRTSVWRGGDVVLDYRQDYVTFEFSALDYSDPESVRYAYRLDGRGDEWIETTAARRLATYTSLAAGDYQLRLRVRQQGGPWVESDRPIALRVLPAPWASPAAYAIYAGAGLFTIVFAWLIARAALRRRSAVQDAMRHSAERLKLALWGSGSELWDVDLRTGAMVRENRLPHLAANREAAEQSITAYAPFMHPDDLPGFNEALREHLRGKTATFECSYRTLNVDHEWVWLLTRGRAQRDANGRAVRISGTNHDISSLKSAEEALRALNEQLESRVEQRTADLSAANIELRNALDSLKLAQRQLLDAEKLASLGAMVAGIAHEINTPLGISVTAASHLHEEARRLSRLIENGELTRSALQRFEHAAREGTDIVLRNLQRADRLVRSFKQVAVDQSSEERRVIDLGASLGEIITTLGPSLKAAACRIELHCPQLIIVETAPGALYQIVANLVMNSLTHGFDAGTAGEMTLAARRDGGNICIDYRDNGRGMDESVRSRIFEPFFTTRRGQGGSGLGMHIVYNLVVQTLRGSIECSSAPGQGVLFRIVFPAVLPAPGSREEESGSNRAEPGEKQEQAAR